LIYRKTSSGSDSGKAGPSSAAFGNLDVALPVALRRISAGSKHDWKLDDGKTHRPQER
jgi:hypothetical protein